MTTAAIFAITFLRHILFSGLYHSLFFIWFRKDWKHRFLNDQQNQMAKAKLEVARSIIASLIFGLSGTVLIILWQKGFTKIYSEVDAYPLWYLPVSLLLALFIHETYYYWLHRWMHRPKIYRILHQWHHDSIHTNSLTAFSFHPLESILQAAIVPLLVLFLPMHIGVLFFMLLIMTVSATVNHAGVEIYPQKFQANWLLKWLVGATHHDLHHKQFRYNYGLYFTFWDKWMGTESPKYEEVFKDITSGQKKKG